LFREIVGRKLGMMFHAAFDVAPDIVAVRADRMHLVEDRGVFGAPDLIAEN
jgi:hypothetical protein